MQSNNENTVTAKKTPKGWVLVHPRSVRERAEDLEEVETMLEADEIDIARDELRYLLQDCPNHMTVHFMLGDIALAEKDIKLARGHYGYAYEIGHKALKREKFPKPFLQSEPANEIFFESGKQLAWCLKLLEKNDLMRRDRVPAELRSERSAPIAFFSINRDHGFCLATS